MENLVPREVIWMSKPERFEQFCAYARRNEFPSRTRSDRYFIRVAACVGGTLYSHDTYELRLKFEHWVHQQRRKERRRR